MKPAIRTARRRAACLFAAGLGFAGCTTGSTTAMVDGRSRAPDAMPAPAPEPLRTSDRGRRTLPPSPLGQYAPEDVPGAAPGGR